MSNNLVIWPVLLPFFGGVLQLMLHGRLRWQRFLGVVLHLLLLALSITLLYQVRRHGVMSLQAGNWPAPFGISLAADLFSAIMVLLSAIIGLTSQVFALRTAEPDQERYFFYPLFQLQMVGINLSFLTADLFNLFVAFEVMLAASYFLLTVGGSVAQLREGFKYLIINATASTLFLIGLAVLYGMTGSLNMADVARRVAVAADPSVFLPLGIIFMVVFGTKGAVFPLYFWLPRSYHAAPVAVSALFAAMLTKVGVYALIRTFTLIFVQFPEITHHRVLLPIAALTMVLGVLGAISQTDFRRILSYHIISQIGYMIMGLGLFTPLALAGTIFYIAHHIVVKSSLFLVSGVAESVTGTSDLRRFSGLLTTHPGLAALFLGAALSLAGVPPMSGFFSKFVLIQAGVAQSAWGIVAVSLAVSLLTLFSMMKIYRLGFWGETKGERRPRSLPAYSQLILPVGLLVALSAGMGLGAGWMLDLAQEAAAQLMDPSDYIHTILALNGGG